MGRKSILSGDVILEDSKEFASGQRAGEKAAERILKTGFTVKDEDDIEELTGKAFHSPFAPNLPEYIRKSVNDDQHDAYSMGFGFELNRQFTQELETSSRTSPVTEVKLPPVPKGGVKPLEDKLGWREWRRRYGEGTLDYLLAEDRAAYNKYAFEEGELESLQRRVAPDVTKKYRVYHFYPDQVGSAKYDQIDIKSKEDAIEHFNKSRTATEIYEFIGNKRGSHINPKTGLSFDETFEKQQRKEINAHKLKAPKFKTPKAKQPKNALKSKKTGKIYHTKMKGGTALSRRKLKGLKCK